MHKTLEKVVKFPFLITAFTCLIFFFLPFKPKPFGDGEYNEGTINLIEFILNNFSGNVRIDKGLFTLIYYLLPYSIVYYFKTASFYFAAGAVFNCLTTCLAVKYIFKAFELMSFSSKTKLIILVLLSLFPIHIYYAFGVLAEPPAFLIVSLFVYFWIKTSYIGDFSTKNLFLLAILNVALVGVRPNLLPFVAAFLIIILFAKFCWRSKMIYMATFFSFFFLLFFAEKAINNTDGEFKKKVFRYQILWSRFELRDEPYNWLPQHGQDEFASSDYLNNLKKRAELDNIIEVNEYDPTSYYLKWVLNDIKENPFLTLRQYSLKFFQGQSFIISPLMKSDKSPMIKYGIHLFINSINFILIFSSIFGLLILYRNNQTLLLLPFFFLWGWSLLYIFIFHSEQRYMFPARPILIFLTAYCFNKLSSRGNSVN
ncbi:MAG: hypothetical protein ACOH1O_13915 [Flavobacterium sp.]